MYLFILDFMNDLFATVEPTPYEPYGIIAYRLKIQNNKDIVYIKLIPCYKNVLLDTGVTGTFLTDIVTECNVISKTDIDEFIEKLETNKLGELRLNKSSGSNLFRLIEDNIIFEYAQGGEMNMFIAKKTNKLTTSLIYCFKQIRENL